MGISIEENILKMNYRNEKTHDALLIDLVKELASKGCLDILWVKIRCTLKGENRAKFKK